MTDAPEQNTPEVGYAQGACELHSHPLARVASPPVASPRKRRGKPQTNPLGVRLRDGQRNALDHAAAASGLSVNAIVCDAIDKQAASILGLRQPSPRQHVRADSEELRKILVGIGRIGGNVNQMALRANRTGHLPAMHQLEAAQAEITSMRAALMEALGHVR